MKRKRAKSVKKLRRGNLSDELEELAPPLQGQEPLVSIICDQEQPSKRPTNGLPSVPEGDEPIVVEPKLNFLKEAEVKPLITVLLHLWNDPDFWEFLSEDPQPNSPQVGEWISKKYLRIPTECPTADQWREMVSNPTSRVAFFSRLFDFDVWAGALPRDESDEAIAQNIIGNAGSRKVKQSSDPLARQLCDLAHLYVAAPADVDLRERMQEILAPRGVVNDNTRAVASRLAKDLASFAQSKQNLPRFHLFLAKRAGRQLELETALRIEEMVRETMEIEDAGQQDVRKPWSTATEREAAKKAQRLLEARGRVAPASADPGVEESWLETLYRQKMPRVV